MGKVISGILVVLVVIGGAWYFLTSSPAPAPAQVPTQADTAAQNPAPVIDTSDAALDSDMTQIDAQAKDAGDASAAANTFNDTPVQQAE